jgi:hypothetical protein
MTIPGYVAEMSLYQTRQGYVGYGQPARRGSGYVRPQQGGSVCLDACADIFAVCVLDMTLLGFLAPIFIDAVCVPELYVCAAQCGV